jgi:hypothetical protein
VPRSSRPYRDERVLSGMSGLMDGLRFSLAMRHRTFLISAAESAPARVAAPVPVGSAPEFSHPRTGSSAQHLRAELRRGLFTHGLGIGSFYLWPIWFSAGFRAGWRSRNGVSAREGSALSLALRQTDIPTIHARSCCSVTGHELTCAENDDKKTPGFSPCLEPLLRQSCATGLNTRAT